MVGTPPRSFIRFVTKQITISHTNYADYAKIVLFEAEGITLPCVSTIEADTIPVSCPSSTRASPVPVRALRTSITVITLPEFL